MTINELEIALQEVLKAFDKWRDHRDPRLDTRKTCMRTLELAEHIKKHTGSPEDVRSIATLLTKMAKSKDRDLSWDWRISKNGAYAQFLGGGSPEFRGVDEHGWSLPPDHLG